MSKKILIFAGQHFKTWRLFAFIENITKNNDLLKISKKFPFFENIFFPTVLILNGNYEFLSLRVPTTRSIFFLNQLQS